MAATKGHSTSGSPPAKDKPARDDASCWTTPDPRGVVDLHIHTTASDGSESPRQLFEMAREMGLRAIGFCDHDSIGSVREGLALAEEFGIGFVPACEIGIAHDPDRGLIEADLVIYCFDPESDELNEVLARLRRAKNNKLDRQLEVLNEVGFHVPKEEVLAEAQGETIRRPHIFTVLKRHQPETQPGVFYTNTDFNGPWYVPKEYNLSLEDCVAVVERAGGITVLSSPGSLNKLYRKDRTLIDPDVDRIIALCASAGVRALETIYTYDCNKPYYHGPEQTITAEELDTLICHYEELADHLGMVKTGGSDFHGKSKPQISLGEIAVPYRYFENLKRAVDRH